MFGYTIIKKNELAMLRHSGSLQVRIANCHRWFSGWKDLEIIWRYIFGGLEFDSISFAREEYAKARGTDEYGKSIK